MAFHVLEMVSCRDTKVVGGGCRHRHEDFSSGVCLVFVFYIVKNIDTLWHLFSHTDTSPLTGHVQLYHSHTNYQSVGS